MIAVWGSLTAFALVDPLGVSPTANGSWALFVALAVIDLTPENRTRRRVRESVQVRKKGERLEQAEAVCGEEISGKLREAEVHLAQGETVGQVVRRLGVSEQSYYRWRREYGGMRVDQAKRLVAEQALDNSILREVASGNF